MQIFLEHYSADSLVEDVLGARCMDAHQVRQGVSMLTTSVSKEDVSVSAFRPSTQQHWLHPKTSIFSTYSNSIALQLSFDYQ